MTGLNQSADEHIKKRTELRKQIEDFTDKENSLIKEKLPLESELTTLQKEVAQAKEKIDKREISQQGCSNGGEEVTRESVRGDVPQIKAKYREIVNYVFQKSRVLLYL